MNFTLFKNVLIIILTVTIFYYLLKPLPLLWYYRKVTGPDVKIPGGDIVDTVTLNYNSKVFSGNIYRISRNSTVDWTVEIKSSNETGNTNTGDVATPSALPEDYKTESKSNRIILWIHGGAFMTTYAVHNNEFYFKLAQTSNRDVYVFDYPSHFKYAQDFIIQYLKTVLAKFKSFADICLGGDSAGGYYIMYLLNYANKSQDVVESRTTHDVQTSTVPKNMVIINDILPALKVTDDSAIYSYNNIKTFLFLCPFFGKTSSPLLNVLFSLYFNKNCNQLSVDRIISRPSLLITTTSDYFDVTNQAIVENSQEQMVSLRYDCPLCGHVFPTITPTLDHSIHAIKAMGEFIKKYEEVSARKQELENEKNKYL